MPFSNNRRYYIAGIIVFAIIAGLIINGAISSGPAKKNIKESEVVTVTILKDVGIDTVTYTNYDVPGETKTLTIIDLPYSFNTSRGDTLELTETTRSGYLWNSWDFSPMSRSNRDNPLVLDTSDPLYCFNNEIIITPSCNFQRVMASPTPSPSPSPSPSPTPVE